MGYLVCLFAMVRIKFILLIHGQALNWLSHNQFREMFSDL